MLRTRTSQLISKHQVELKRNLNVTLEQFAAAHVVDESNRFYGMHEYNRISDHEEEDEFQKIVNLNRMYQQNSMLSPEPR